MRGVRVGRALQETLGRLPSDPVVSLATGIVLGPGLLVALGGTSPRWVARFEVLAEQAVRAVRRLVHDRVQVGRDDVLTKRRVRWG
jgi:hypothetical protein